VAYCVTADVSAALPDITIGLATKPTTAQVDQYCLDISADMDRRFNAVGITVPVVDADLLAFLKPIAVNGVLAKLLRAKQAEDGSGEQAATFEGLYQDAMQRIEMRPSILRETDAPGRPQGTARSTDDIAFTRTGTEW
jgi:hypothetical protein